MHVLPNKYNEKMTEIYISVLSVLYDMTNLRIVGLDQLVGKTVV